MRTIVIPDIHNKIDIAQKLIDKHSYVDKRVFLGDIYDDFGDNENIIADVAQCNCFYFDSRRLE